MSSNWGGPEYNGVKVLVLAIVVGFAGYFVYNSMHKNAVENTGQVIDANSASAMNVATGPGLGFSIVVTGKTCTATVVNALNFKESITVTGNTGANGDCDLKGVKQSSLDAQRMADAMSGVGVK